MWLTSTVRWCWRRLIVADPDCADWTYQYAADLSRHRSACTAVLIRPAVVVHLLPTGVWQRGHRWSDHVQVGSGPVGSACC